MTMQPFEGGSTAAKEEEQTVRVEPCETKPTESGHETEAAVFGAGCFWGVEAAFARLSGVVETSVGYAGGHVDHPSYEQVCSDRTGHAEVVRVVFDPQQISFRTLVETFFSLHDPTQLNRQGPDHGSQYRSAILCCDSDQADVAEAVRDELTRSGSYAKPIVTEIGRAQTFWRAEEYHQRYLEKNRAAFCSI